MQPWYLLLWVMTAFASREHPNEEWMMAVANKVTNAETGFLRGKKILLLDRDTKFTLKFREHLKAAGTEPFFLPNLRVNPSSDFLHHTHPWFDSQATDLDDCATSGCELDLEVCWSIFANPQGVVFANPLRCSKPAPGFPQAFESA